MSIIRFYYYPTLSIPIILILNRLSFSRTHRLQSVPTLVYLFLSLHLIVQWSVSERLWEFHQSPGLIENPQQTHRLLIVQHWVTWSLVLCSQLVFTTSVHFYLLFCAILWREDIIILDDSAWFHVSCSLGWVTPSNRHLGLFHLLSFRHKVTFDRDADFKSTYGCLVCLGTLQ